MSSLTPILWDIIIVGGGPAGSTAAYLLAKNGFSVLLLDKQNFPRPKLCAGLITKKTVSLLNQIFKIDVDFLKSNNILLAQNREYGIYYRNKRLVCGQLDYPFHFIDRSLYDHAWLKKAIQAGVTVKTSTCVNSFDSGTGTLHTESGDRYQAKYIIGADGAFSRIKSELLRQGLIEKPEKAPAMGLETFLVKSATDLLPPHPAIVFGFIHRGYAWCFPQGNRYVLGICAPKKGEGPGSKKRLLEFLTTLKINPSDCERIKGHPLPYGNFMQAPGIGNTLLIGDAAGFADPLLGEGIYYAHDSAVLAAQAVLAAEKMNVSADQHYFQSLRPTILKEMKYARIFQWGVHTLLRPKEFFLFGLGMKMVKKVIEETIQGDRSFAWLKKSKRSLGETP